MTEMVALLFYLGVISQDEFLRIMRKTNLYA